jgi:hypothetical protein
MRSAVEHEAGGVAHRGVGVLEQGVHQFGDEVGRERSSPVFGITKSDWPCQKARWQLRTGPTLMRLRIRWSRGSVMRATMEGVSSVEALSMTVRRRAGQDCGEDAVEGFGDGVGSVVDEEVHVDAGPGGHAARASAQAVCQA